MRGRDGAIPAARIFLRRYAQGLLEINNGKEADGISIKAGRLLPAFSF